jgi:hypothetical protein
MPEPLATPETEDENDLVGSLPLTPKEAAFVRYYGNPESESYGHATNSAAKAGFVQPRSAALKLRRRPRVIAALVELQKVVAGAAERVLADLEHVRLLALQKGDLAVAARCVELAGKHLGLFYESNVVIDVAALRHYTDEELTEGRRLAAFMASTYGQVLEGDVPAALPGQAPVDQKGS